MAFPETALRTWLWWLIALGLAIPGGAQTLVAIDGPPASLSATAVAARGRSEVTLEVRRFGRYSVLASSPTGVGLQLVDRMAGPGPVTGVPGESDGRLDLFLDRGQYKIVVHGHDQGSGSASLEVVASRERNPVAAPQLIPLKAVSENLADHEQRSYWLHLETAEWVHLEAAGRALVDLRLWREGTWLEDARPTFEVVAPVEGQPLLVARMVARLEPGLYLLGAYGGRPQPWAEDADASPFHLRRGIPTLAMAGRSRREVSPFGIDRFLIPAKANLYRLELPEAVPARLTVSFYEEHDPFTEAGPDGFIDKDSRVPATEVTTSSRERGFDVVVIRAGRGQPYILQHFEHRSWYRFSGTGDYWISTVHTGHAEDSVDATGILDRWTGRRSHREPLREQTIPLDLTTGWATRANLLDTLTVHLHVRTTGTYTLESEGSEALFRIEPFLVDPPADYQSPPLTRPGPWELDAGFYVLTVEPVEKGILELAIRPEGLVGDLLELVGVDPASPEPVRAAVRFESVPLSSGHSYTLHLNHQPGVKAGLILRRLPLDLRQALPLAIRPGRQVEVSFASDEACLLRARTEDGSALPLSVDDGPWRDEAGIAAGRRQTVVVKNDGEATVVCSLEAIPERLLASTPLPPLPAATLAGLPELPVIDGTAPHFFDLDRRQRATFKLSADDDALYRLESTGLLDTEGTVRSRTITALASADSGGSGRNFHLHQYLLAGDYQLTLATRGRSAGHLGLSLERTEPTSGGRLEPDRPARAEVSAGEALLYTFAIAEAGTYRVRSMALGATVHCRLEDGDGWPLVAPNGTADLTLDLAPGDYRLVLLPTPVAGRRLTLLEELRGPTPREGHGPHRLDLGQPRRHVWTEPAEGGERTPDRWDFTLPAAGEVRVEVDGAMTGRLLGGDGEVVGEVMEGRGFRGVLGTGEHRLELVCARRDNLVDYRLAVTPVALMVGTSRPVRAPASVAVAVGRPGLVELSSFGPADVRARLVDGDGLVVAASDDRRGDWNFLISDRLEPGDYTLEVQPVGADALSTVVSMEMRDERHLTATTLPLATIHEPGDDVLVLPLEAATGEVLLVSARADEAVGLAVESDPGDGWRPLVSRVGGNPFVAVAPGDAGALRLRLWSADRRGNPVTLAARAVAPPAVSEAELAAVARIGAVEGFDPPLAVAAVTTARAGTLRLGNPDATLWASLPGQALSDGHDGLPTFAGGRAFLAVAADGGRVAVKAERVRLASGHSVQRGLDAGDRWWLDLAPGGDGPTLVHARATVVQPMIRLGADHRDQALGPDWAAAVALTAPEGAAEVWHTGRARADVKLDTTAFPRPEAGTAGWGANDGTVAAGRAVALTLPPGAKRLHLTLAPGLVAALSSGSAVASVHSGGETALSESLDTSADTLTVIGASAGGYSVAVLAAPARAALAPGRALEYRASHGGRLRLTVDEALAGLELHLAGAATAATVVGDDGWVVRGAGPLALGAGPSTVTIDHAPGLVLAWLGPAEDPSLGLWRGVAADALPVTLPAAVALSGSEGRFAAATATPGLLSVAVATPCLLRVSPGSGPPRHLLALTPSTLHLAVTAGAVEVGLMALGGQELGGALELALSPLASTAEGLGDEVLLAPGAGRAFRFEVVEPGPVGVGLRADPDTVEGRLLAADGRVLGEGVIQLHDLAAGTYLLLASAPADSPPVRVRPAVVGLERPATGPPEEVIRDYVQGSHHRRGER